MTTPSRTPDVPALKRTAVELRQTILRMIARAGSGHPGGSLSMVELLVGLYWHALRHDPKRPDWPDRDLFLLSKGHGCPALYAVLAAQLDQLGRRDAARASLVQTLQLDEHHLDAMNYLGYLDAEAGEHLEEAKRLIERALALDPDNGAYVDSLGWVYFKMGHTEEAVQFLERASRLLDSDPVIFDHLGDAYFKQQDLDGARRSWERALELNPEHLSARVKLDRLPPQPHQVTVTTS